MPLLPQQHMPSPPSSQYNPYIRQTHHTQQNHSHQDYIAQQQTIPQPAVSPITTPPGLFSLDTSTGSLRRKQILRKLGVLLAVPALVGIFVIIWYTAPPATISGSQNISSSSSSTSFSSTPSSFSSSSSGSSGGEIQVYIVGAVKHPGVYTLSSDARVYQLIQAAGGPLPEANLVAINLAAKLNDGEEVYVTLIGEVPPTYMGGVPGPGTGNGTPTGNSSGQFVNINTASVDQLRTDLHVSSTTANAIVNYRLQNGPYTSTDQLLQVVSKEIYDHIKDQVTV